MIFFFFSIFPFVIYSLFLYPLGSFSELVQEVNKRERKEAEAWKGWIKKKKQTYVCLFEHRIYLVRSVRMICKILEQTKETNFCRSISFFFILFFRNGKAQHIPKKLLKNTTKESDALLQLHRFSLLKETNSIQAAHRSPPVVFLNSAHG